MIQRLQYFSIVCAIILFSGCLGSFIGSVTQSRGCRVPTWRVVLGELPLLIYIFLFVGFLMPPKLPDLQILIIGCSAATLLVAFLIRVFNYSTRHEARERAELLAAHQEAARTIEEAKVRVMSLVEKERFLEATKPKRVSRYERPPVI